MWWLLLILFVLLAALAAVLLWRTLQFVPAEQEMPEDETVAFDRDRAVKCLQALVRCKTVSYRDPALEDDAEFEKLLGILPRLYPNVFKICAVGKLPDRAILIRWEGKAHDAPAVLMAHYDVVPVNEESWEKPAFEGVLENDVLWGRGTLDTKVTVNGILFAADHLIAEGFCPEQDVYFAFSGGEEVNGDGALRIVEWFEKQGITPAMVLDEGGAVVNNVFPGVSVPCGLIGIAEKGMLNAKFTVNSAGGHASAPKPGAPIDRLSRACLNILRKPFDFHVTPPVEKLFDTLGRHSSFVYRMIFANLWLFAPILDLICRRSGGELNALMRTTVAFTQMQGSSAANVIPPRAEMVANLRLNPCDTVESALERLRSVIGDENVEVSAVDGMDPSRISVTDCEGYRCIANAVAATWKGCIVSPYLMVQCSDSRHYGRISDKVYRFSAMDLTAEERATIHGNNERIRLECLWRSVEFFIRLNRQL
ncbi:MAG: M20/M25/M40 family metallo-hydrolase [Clostridia bacterium]|nr:M20/M25/M40 family metallo-hydrolase [Clostridia bacterium]